MEQLMFVYALCDPDTEEARYIGISSDPERRLQEHTTDCSNVGRSIEWKRANGIVPRAKNAWLFHLKQQGKRPTIHILDMVVGRREAQRLEQRFVEEYLQAGARLMNVYLVK